MKILVFTEGTLIMHRNAAGHTRKEIVEQVKANEESINDYASYIPVGNAVEKLKAWEKQGAEILYLTSRTKPEEIEDIVRILEKYDFPEGLLLSRQGSEDYKDVAERIAPDVLIEDDCESIGGR
jgi:2-methylisocitrate lyase-like PEP mutase family enzyme